MAGVGKRTVAEARSDERLIESVAEVTGLAVDEVQDRLEAVHGATRIRNAFAEWPSDPDVLGAMTTAFAVRHGLQDEIRALIGSSQALVTRRLNASHGKKLVRNVFWDSWPEEGWVPPTPRRERAETDAQQGLGSEPPPAWMRPALKAARKPERERVAADAGAHQSIGELFEALFEESASEAATSEEASEEGHDTEPPPADHAAAEITVGTLLSSRYELRRRLGQGGFGVTWEAHDRLSGLELAVKIPHEEDGGAIRRELAQAFRLVHPNICQAFPDRDDETGHPFLVLQHGGEDLAQRLHRTGEPFPVVLAVQVLTSIADALDYLHDRLVVHLDVSPANILIDDEDVVRLTDFGASSHARTTKAPDGSETLMATSVAFANPHYRAPEMAHGEGRGSSDQYSLALVFCTLLEGEVVRGMYRFKDLPCLSPTQNAVVRRALSFDPADRFDSCGEFARAVADDLVRTPQHVLAADLDRLSLHLLHRFDRELGRRSTTSTARLGGVVHLGRAVENLLHAIVLFLAASDGFDPEQELHLVDPKTPSLARATAGKMAKVIQRRRDGAAARTPQARPLIEDLDSESSRLWRLINVRNDIVHGKRTPDAVVPATIGVAMLLRDYRREAGWGVPPRASV